MELIWAYGQSGIDFYKEDELKYHGGPNRGHRKIGRKGGLDEIKLNILSYIIEYQQYSFFYLVTIANDISYHLLKAAIPRKHPPLVGLILLITVGTFICAFAVAAIVFVVMKFKNEVVAQHTVNT